MDEENDNRSVHSVEDGRVGEELLRPWRQVLTRLTRHLTLTEPALAHTACMSNWRYLATAGGRGTAVLDKRAARTAHKASSNLETAVPSGRRRRVAAGDERKEGPPKLMARRRPEFR